MNLIRKEIKVDLLRFWNNKMLLMGIKNKWFKNLQLILIDIPFRHTRINIFDFLWSFIESYLFDFHYHY